MAVYVAMVPPDGNRENTVFVRDGFTFLAFLVPWLWFLAHRMWIEAALALGLTLLFGLADGLVGGAAAPVVTLLLSLLAGFEAPQLRLLALRRRFWHERGVVEAANREDAEARFFLDGAEVPDQEVLPPAERVAGRPMRGVAPALGLFDRRGIA